LIDICYIETKVVSFSFLQNNHISLFFIESNQINYLLIIQKLRFVRVIKDSYIYKI
jgi:hypothetical protein